MVNAENICFQSILKNISFTLPAGKTLAVVGHNGAGKTTLFQVLLGLKFAQGEYFIDRNSLGYVPERPYLPMDEVFFDYLRLHLRLIAFNQNHESEIIRVAKIVGLEQKLQKKFSEFSKGMLQKALIAQALLGHPKTLILDEPLSGLDAQSRSDIRDLLLSFKKEETTLIFSSHALEDVDVLADFILTLNQGQVQTFQVNSK